MPQLRKNAKIGDIIIGIAGAGQKGLGRIHPQLIYWMQVEEDMHFDNYWQDPRFIQKMPNIDGPKLNAVGDNTYRHDPVTGSWVFEPSMHYIPGSPQPNGGHVVKDTKVDRLLLSRRFTYWGNSGPVVPNHLMTLFSNPRGYKCNHDPGQLSELHELIDLEHPAGVVGDPTDWDNPKYFE